MLHRCVPCVCARIVSRTPRVSANAKMHYKGADGRGDLFVALCFASVTRVPLSHPLFYERYSAHDFAFNPFPFCSASAVMKPSASWRFVMSGMFMSMALRRMVKPSVDSRWKGCVGILMMRSSVPFARRSETLGCLAVLIL